MSSSGVIRQLTLPVSPPEHYSLESFVAGANAEALTSLRGLLGAEPGQVLFLWGGPATGKTHLLNAACRMFAAHERQLAYFALREAVSLHQPVLLEFEKLPDLVCLDDLQAICGNEAWEIAVFELYNRVVDEGSLLVLSADAAPSSLRIGLSDLRSRLAAGLVFRLRGLDDDGKRKVLQSRASIRGFELPDVVADYMLRHLPRNLSSLLEALDNLDTASLAAQRRLTIPFLKLLLEERSGTLDR